MRRMPDRSGCQSALNLDLKSTGLLGILKDAEKFESIDLSEMLDRLLMESNFRTSPKSIKSLLQDNSQ